MNTKKIYFYAIDSWDRATFKQVGENEYYCSVDHLFDCDATASEVLATISPDDIIYKGSHLESEPMGTSADVDIMTLEEVKKENRKVQQVINKLAYGTIGSAIHESNYDKIDEFCHCWHKHIENSEILHEDWKSSLDLYTNCTSLV